MEDQTIPVIVNPFVFLKADERYSQGQRITEKDILEFVSGELMVPEVKNFINHYKTIEKNIPKAFAIPAEAQIITKVVRPLKQAISSFMIGNFLSTISTCGFVAEMITVFLYETSNISINQEKISNVEKKLFGRDFEKLGQERRLDILQGFSVIDDKTYKKFNDVRLSRNKYLHRFSEKHEQIAPDASEIFHKTLELFLLIFDQKIKDGKVYYNQNVVRYLKEKGIMD